MKLRLYISIVIILVIIGCNRPPTQKISKNRVRSSEAPVLTPPQKVKEFIQKIPTVTAEPFVVKRKQHEFNQPSPTPPIKKAPPKEFDLSPKVEEPKILRKPTPTQVTPQKISPKPSKKEIDTPVAPKLNNDYFAKLIIKGKPHSIFFILHPSGSKWVEYRLGETGQKELSVRKEGLSLNARYYYFIRTTDAGHFRNVEFGFGQTVTVQLD